MMYKYIFLLNLLDRRKINKPPQIDRRALTRKEASELLTESINNLERTIKRAVERSSK